MKKYPLYILSALLLIVAGCKEDIDDGDFAIATGLTIAEYVSENPELSDFEYLLRRVSLGSKAEASSVYNVLSARGNYTCFFPDNKAVRAFCKERIGTEDVTQLDNETVQLLVYNSVIDNGDAQGYESPDFPENGAFGLPCLSDRLLNCKLNKEGGYTLNSSSNITKADIESTNGFVNIVDAPIAPSMLMVPDIILQASNLKIMGTLLIHTAWADSMQAFQDAEFNAAEHPETRLFTNVGNFKVEQHRYLGYTAFVEPDSIFQCKWGIPAPQLDADGNVTNFSDIVAALKPHCEAIYGTADADSLKSPDNAVNRFVAYHLMKGRYAYNKLLHHFSEYGYQYGSYVTNPQEDLYTVDVWDYYPTLGNKYPSLLKLVQVPTGEHEIYINRVSTYNTGNYQVSQVRNPGVQVLKTNGDNDNNALNGFYHILDDILVYDDNVRNLLGSERIRFDLCDMLPELTSNAARTQGYKGFERGYFENIFNETESTNIFYLTAPKGANWRDYQGDEFLFSGTYDFCVKLPPVPVDGTYELRMGVAMNPSRSMAQIYFGDNPENLQPAGLPYDLRQSASNNPAMPWREDTGDENVDRENDQALRIQGYMKAPKYFCSNDGTGKTPARSFGGDWPCMRRIITTANMASNKTYYLRFKTALENTDSQFFLDYFEIVPTIVYNGTEAEDIW